MPTEAAKKTALDQELGLSRNGRVDLRAFDEGVVLTMGAFEQDDAYWLKIDGVDPPPGMPGVPVSWSFSEDLFKTYKLPMVLVRRDGIAPAMERWHPGTVTYRVPALGDIPGVARGVHGPRRVEEQRQASPFDITYEISVLARYRGGLSLRGQVNRVFQYVLSIYQAYSRVFVTDSVGEPRYYFAFMEGTSVLDEIGEIAERVLGFGVTVRVEAELDQNDPYLVPTVWNGLTLNLSQK